MVKSRVSEGIDDLFSRMTDLATGDKAIVRARKAFFRGLKRNDETTGWVAALNAAGATDNPTNVVGSAESLTMGGNDYSWAKVNPHDYNPDALESCRTAAWHDIIGIGINEQVARRLVQFWEEYYGNPKNTGAKPYDQEHEVNEAEQTGPSPKGFVQIGGDFGDPWVYGGTWFNEQTGTILHFGGIEYEKDIEADSSNIDKVVSFGEYQTILNAVNAERDEDWMNTEEEIRQAHADSLNAARRFDVYETCTEDDAVVERDWADHIAGIKAAFGDEGEDIWGGMSPANKLAEIADNLGWEEFDPSPSKLTKAELSKRLGIEL